MFDKIIAAALALACGLGATAARAEIVVGFITGLSGAVSSIGIPNGKGIAAGMAFKSEVGGEPIRVIRLDDASDPAATVRNVRKLVEQEKVDFLIGTSGAPHTFAMATVAVELKVPMVAISPIAEPPKGDGGPWVVQIPHPQRLLAQGIVADMKRRNVQTVSFIGFSDALGDLMYDSLTVAAQEAGIKVLANERYARTDTSVMPQVLKAVSARPDAIMVGGTATPGALPVLALSERGYKGVIYGNNGMISTDFLRVAGKAAEGLICPTGPVAVAEQLADNNPIKPVALAYRAAYEKANASSPSDGFSAYAFDGWLVFLDAARRAIEGGAKPGSAAFRDALRQALYSSKEIVGTHAVYNFTPQSSLGVDERSRVLVKIERGGWKLLP